MTVYRLPTSFLRSWHKQARPLCNSWTCNLHSSGLTWPRYESWVTWCLSQSFMGCVKILWHGMMYAGTAKLKDIHRCCTMSGWWVARKQFHLGRYPLTHMKKTTTRVEWWELMMNMIKSGCFCYSGHGVTKAPFTSIYQDSARSCDRLMGLYNCAWRSARLYLKANHVLCCLGLKNNQHYSTTIMGSFPTNQDRTGGCGSRYVPNITKPTFFYVFNHGT